jgi:hypothetical protein
LAHIVRLAVLRDKRNVAGRRAIGSAIAGCPIDTASNSYLAGRARIMPIGRFFPPQSHEDHEELLLELAALSAPHPGILIVLRGFSVKILIVSTNRADRCPEASPDMTWAGG